MRHVRPTKLTTARIIGIPFVGMLYGLILVLLRHGTSLSVLGAGTLAWLVWLPNFVLFYYLTRG